MIYFSQRDPKFKNVPYPSSELPKATLFGSGCGPTCGAMIISNLTSQLVTPKEMAQYCIKTGARVVGGTDVTIMSEAIKRDYKIDYTKTNSEIQLIDHLNKGGMAIANVSGNKGTYKGVFSDGGHFIVVAGITENGSLIILDPGLYEGKFLPAHRKGKVGVKNSICYCSIEVLAEDTARSYNQYWLFSRKEDNEVAISDEFKAKMVELMAKAKEMKLVSEVHNPTDTATKWFVMVVVMNAIKYVLEKRGE